MDRAQHNLIEAAREGNVDALYAILRSFPTVLDHADRHSLIEAAREGNVDALYAKLRSLQTVLDRAQHNLIEAAREGNVDALYATLRSLPTVLDRTQHSLIEAARAGNVDTLYATLLSFPTVLDEIDRIPLVHTPLHEAALAGHTEFALEILSLKPSFGMKLNPHGQSPLHLALQNRREKTVKGIINNNSELIRVKGRKLLTPLHYAAQTGDTNLLAEFLVACPASIKDLNIREETVLHIAAKNRQYLAFRLIFQWSWRTYNGELLIVKDADGNTVLHIAVLTDQLEIAKLLIKKAPIIKDEKNAEGRTALGIACDHHQEEMIKLLRHTKRSSIHIGDPVAKYGDSLDAHSIADKDSLAHFLLFRETYFERVIRFILYCRRDLSLDMRNMVLVVAVLIATAAFEAITKDEATNKDNDTTKSATPNGFMYWFYSLNTLAFTSSIAVMISVVSMRPFTTFLHASLACLAVTAGYSMYYRSPSHPVASALILPSALLLSAIYSFKIYFGNMEREIKMELPAIWMEPDPSWRALPPVPLPLPRLRKLYRLMGLNI